MRQLATIRKILDIAPITGADAIECATIDGWKVVVKKGEFQIGEDVVYFEIDSFIPTTIAPFLTKPGHAPKVYNGIEGERLRTVKLRGQISQGLVLPLSAFDWPDPEGPPSWGDVTDILEIQKWEPSVPAELVGVMRGNFPSFIRKTDQERIQNLGRQVFDGDVNETSRYEITLKLNGSSMTVYYNNGAVGVCSRNIDLLLDQSGNVFVDTAVRIGVLEALKNYGRNIAIQGELVGDRIQGNYEGIEGDPQFFVFDVWDIDAQAFLDAKSRRSLCVTFGLSHVPILNFNTLLGDVGALSVSDILKLAEGPSINNPVREGLVFKRTDGGFSFKAVSTAFLLNGGDSR